MLGLQFPNLIPPISFQVKTAKCLIGSPVPLSMLVGSFDKAVHDGTSASICAVASTGNVCLLELIESLNEWR